MPPEAHREMIEMQGNKQDIEKLLSEGKTIQIRPNGYSMYPLFVPGRDEAVIAPVDTVRLKRGDVVLYRREKSILVLHRIWKCKNGEFYLVGDNQRQVEGPLRADQMRGVLVGVIRKGRYFPVENRIYKILSGVWLALRPLRPVLSKAAAWGKRIFKRFGRSMPD